MQNKKIVIGLTGEMSSGKGTVAKYLAEKYQASYYRYSSILRDILNRLHLEISRQNLSLTYKILTKNFGKDILSKVLLSEIKNDQNRIIVIDGIRTIADLKIISQLKNFILIGITAEAKTRYQRLISRNENKGDNQKTYQQFIEDQNRLPDSQIKLILDKAAIVIANNNSKEKLFKQIDQIIANN